MSKTARKPRTIREVKPYRRDDGAARCVVTLDDGEKVGLHDLTRPELAAAARQVFPSLPGNVWLRFPTTTLSNLIRHNVLEDAEKAVADLAPPKQTPKRVTLGGGIDRGLDHTRILDEARDLVRQAQDDDQDDEVDEVDEEAPQAPQPTIDLDQSDPAAVLAAAIRTIAESAKQQAPVVDLDEVRRAVTAQADEVLDRFTGTLEQAVKEAVEAIGIRRVVIVVNDEERDLPEQHHQLLPELIQVLSAGLHVFLPGPAGSGKSTLAHQAADALGLPFFSVSFGPTTPTSKLFGYNDANGNHQRTPFREAYEFGGIFLGDEIDNGHPGLVAELNQALANGYCAFADGMVKRHESFRMVVTGNTFGRGPDRLYVGRNILDAATLDRFVTLECPVDDGLERGVALSFATDATRAAVDRWVTRVQRVRANVTDLKLPVVVSPRASIDGAKLLAAGVAEERVAEVKLYAGIDADTRRKIDAR
jgi:MoxR-like ATPase